MLNAIRKWWTPMVPEALLKQMREHLLDSEKEVDHLEQSVVELSYDNAQLQADLGQSLLDRDAALLERDKAIGKFEYVEAAKKELETKLADHVSYIKILEDQLKQYMEQESEDDDFDDFLDDEEDVDDVCYRCGLEWYDCDFDDNESEDNEEDDE